MTHEPATHTPPPPKFQVTLLLEVIFAESGPYLIMDTHVHFKSFSKGNLDIISFFGCDPSHTQGQKMSATVFVGFKIQ